MSFSCREKLRHLRSRRIASQGAEFDRRELRRLTRQRHFFHMQLPPAGQPLQNLLHDHLRRGGPGCDADRLGLRDEIRVELMRFLDQQGPGRLRKRATSRRRLVLELLRAPQTMKHSARSASMRTAPWRFCVA